MAIIESTPRRVVLRSGSTKITLDKDTGKAILERKLLFWSLKPRELPLAELAEVAVDAGVDRASGIEVCNAILLTRTGGVWAMPASSKKDAEETAGALRDFLGLRA